MDIKINNNEIYISGKLTRFDFNINKIIEFSSGIIIMFVGTDEILDNNILMIDYSGNVQWNISDIIKLGYVEAYIALSKEGESVFSVISYNGLKSWIDINSRQIIKKSITK